MTKRNKSKTKGNRFENQIYDLLREKGYWVRKNKGSGNAEDNKGDLETKNLLIECKHHKSVTIKQVNEWMNKIYTEALPLGKYPILLVKENYKPIKVYYVGQDSKIYFMPFDKWVTDALPYERQEEYKPRTDIPSYIG